MEFQDFVNTTTDYLQVCKDKDLKVIKYKQYALIKTLRDKEYDYETYPWMRYCRGIIVDTKTNKVICVPPMKSIEFSSTDECYFPDNNDKEYYICMYVHITEYNTVALMCVVIIHIIKIITSLLLIISNVK